MGAGAAPRLTERQRAVMERIDRRVPIKVIAAELGVSDTRINQHIRALKDVYRAASLGELVENYRATIVADPSLHSSDDALGMFADDALATPFSEAAYTISQINAASDLSELRPRNDPGQLVLGDAMPLIEQAPWLRPGEPRVVPGVLDGEHAVLLRLGAIVGIAAGILASVILVIAAATSLSLATEGKAYLSVQSEPAAG